MKCCAITKKLRRCQLPSKSVFFPFCHLRAHRIQPFAFLLSIITIVGTTAGIYQDLIKEISSASGELIYQDRYLTVKTKGNLVGEFCYCDGYSVPLEISNNRDMDLIIPKATFYFINPKVQEILHGFPTMKYGSFSICEFINPGHGFLSPKETRKIEPDGPQFIPQKVVVEIDHSGSQSGSKIEFTLSKEENVEYWDSPKHLNIADAKFGIDGGIAYQQAVEVADDVIGSSEYLSMVLVMESSKVREGSGLDVIETRSWFFLFVIPGSGIGAGVNVDSTGARGSVMTTEEYPDYEEFMKRYSSKPIQIGTADAIAMVNRLDLIYGNACVPIWFEPNAVVNGEERPVWQLPYAGEDYMPLYIDAYSGDVLLLDIQYQQTVNKHPWHYNVIHKREALR